MRAAVYTSMRHGTGASIERQRDTAFGIAEANGYQVTVEFTDVLVGATRRPGLERAIEAVKRGDVDVLVASRLDRMAGTVIDTARLLEIPIITAEVNTTTASGRLMAGIVGGVANIEERDRG